MSKRTDNSRLVPFFRALIASLVFAEAIGLALHVMLPGMQLILCDAYALMAASISYLPFLMLFKIRAEGKDRPAPQALASFHIFF